MSPSKTQDFDVPIRGACTQPFFVEQTKQLVRQLKQLDQPQLAQLMKMSDKLAAVNFQRFQDFRQPFTPDNSRQALFMFRGDQFNPITVDSYSEEQLGYAQRHLRILSGLYGMLRPLDLMQPYRLEMATKIAIGETKNLYSFWSEMVTRELNKQLQTDPQPVLVNLASAEYFKVISKKELQADILTFSFKQEGGYPLHWPFHALLIIFIHEISELQRTSFKKSIYLQPPCIGVTIKTKDSLAKAAL